MYKISLLERLSALEEPLLVVGRTAERQLRDSIVGHLRKLLNTRAGSVPIDPNYGLPDMSNIAGSFALGTTESLSESIIRQVVRYEKRLLNPKIAVEEEKRDVITLRFELSGQVASAQDGDDVLQPFAMIIRINSSGQVFVESKVDH
ncbi:MAG: type VI secretion system baseplate subunit TssE [Pusillimonas sp.]|jgi:type VI secretion system protein|nr:type VI secretion system baseplate subunit TssE [Pusillimonas sp.]MBC41749.1 type VI secretion system baseplate subunit TssE [Pusillimonas sp.]HCP78697.1 type VI secretion system baseplate subunit TssE [Pusillimonas sp.]|tara:strand:+ start:217395 stop:217835 length:441 start_codon:yes stop_codon:yes gene_type:complete